MLRIYLLISFLLYLCSIFVKAENLPSQLNIYEQFNSYPCVRLADQNGFIGCSSQRSGSIGSLWPIQSDQDVNDFVQTFSKEDSEPKIIVINSTVFTKENVDLLVGTNRINGFLVCQGGAPYYNGSASNYELIRGFSPVHKFPQQKFGLHKDSNFEWNPLGNAFAYESFNIPMFAIDSYNSKYYELMQHAQSNKNSNFAYPRFGASLNSFMYATENSEVCLRRGQCLPIGGQSVWATFGGSINSSKEIVLFIAPMDSNAFFHDLAIGADADMSGVLAILTALEAVSSVYPPSGFERQLVVAFFDAESWGYIGSKRFVDDIMNFQCQSPGSDDGCSNPYRYSLEFQHIKIDNIVAIIELNQVGNLFHNNPDTATVYVHQEPGGTNQLLQLLSSATTGLNIVVQPASSTNPGIPPSSLMSFLAQKPSLNGVVLAEHYAQYTNNFYHSQFDTENNIEINSIIVISSLLARTMIALASNSNSTSEIYVNSSLAAELVNCLVYSLACPLVRHYLDFYSYSFSPSHYCSIYEQGYVLSATGSFIYQYVAALTAVSSAGECQSNSDCNFPMFCTNGTCVQSATYYHDALSLSFEYNSDSGTFSLTDKYGIESTWTESNWGSLYVQLFQMDSPIVDIVVLVIGIVELISSFFIVWLFNKHVMKRFKMP